MTIRTEPLIGRPSSSPRPWNILLGGPETDGLVMVGSGMMPPHTAGPPLHVHTHEDEGFLVTSGVLTAQSGDSRLELHAGEIAWLRRGTPHAFANLSDEPVEMVSVITPGGLSEMFREQDAYLKGLGGAPDPAVLLEMSERYGVMLVGPPLL